MTLAEATDYRYPLARARSWADAWGIATKRICVWRPNQREAVEGVAPRYGRTLDDNHAPRIWRGWVIAGRHDRAPEELLRAFAAEPVHGNVMYRTGDDRPWTVAAAPLDYPYDQGQLDEVTARAMAAEFVARLDGEVKA